MPILRELVVLLHIITLRMFYLVKVILKMEEERMLIVKPRISISIYYIVPLFFIQLEDMI